MKILDMIKDSKDKEPSPLMKLEAPTKMYVNGKTLILNERIYTLSEHVTSMSIGTIEVHPLPEDL